MRPQLPSQSWLFVIGCLVSLNGCSSAPNVIPVIAGVAVGTAVYTSELEKREAELERERSKTDYRYLTNDPANDDKPIAIPLRPVEDTRPTFDGAATRNALAEVDLSTCKEVGLERGYGHARVTVNPDGVISKVVIEEPQKISRAAAKCIGNELAKAKVPEFRGSLVTIGTTFFVP